MKPRHEEGRAGLRRILLGLAGGTALLLAGGLEAGATPALEIVWTDTTGTGTTGSSTIEARPGDEITATLFLSADADGISGYGISLMFDLDLGDELDLVSAGEFLPALFQFNFSSGFEETSESTGATPGRISSYEALTFEDGPVNASFAIGEVVFQVTSNVGTGGADVVSGLYAPGVDAVIGNANQELAADFGTATVNVPEPSTGLLLATALLVLAGRHGCRGSPAS